jgi:hypothetical protein
MDLQHRFFALAIRLRQIHAARLEDRGASTVETVIIVAALAALALAVLAAITGLVNTKVDGIHL